jgi:hypothetical protein
VTEPRSDRSRLMGPEARAWLNAVSDHSEDVFTTVTSPDVELEGSVFVAPICGVEQVYAALRAAGEIYDTLVFTEETTARSRTYLEWNAQALGIQVFGVTVLERNVDGRIANIAIHHRPLGAVETFSRELRHRLMSTEGAAALAPPVGVISCDNPDCVLYVDELVRTFPGQYQLNEHVRSQLGEWI